MKELKTANPKHHKTISDLKNPEMLILHKRLILQAAKQVPPTFGRIASFVEQGMSQNKERRTMTIVRSILDMIRGLSRFYSGQRCLYAASGTVHTVNHCMQFIMIADSDSYSL